jgi:hypothetical protein
MYRAVLVAPEIDDRARYISFAFQLDRIPSYYFSDRRQHTPLQSA